MWRAVVAHDLEHLARLVPGRVPRHDDDLVAAGRERHVARDEPAAVNRRDDSPRGDRDGVLAFAGDCDPVPSQRGAVARRQPREDGRARIDPEKDLLTAHVPGAIRHFDFECVASVGRDLTPGGERLAVQRDRHADRRTILGGDERLERSLERGSAHERRAPIGDRDLWRRPVGRYLHGGRPGLSHARHGESRQCDHSFGKRDRIGDEQPA